MINIRSGSLYLVNLIAILLVFAACKKPKPTDSVMSPIDSVISGQFTFIVHNTIDGNPIEMKRGDDTGTTYYNASGEDFKIKKLLYYLSNLYFLNENDVYIRVLSDDYFLVNQSHGDFLEYVRLPYGQYKGLKMIIGVDSARNVSGIQNGALDPLLGMFWDWNTGYIMAMLEGESSLALGAAGLSYHVGGFMGANSALRNVEIQFDQVLEITEHTNPKLLLTTDILKWFDGNSTIKIADLSIVVSEGIHAQRVADNYKEMFISAHVQQ